MILTIIMLAIAFECGFIGGELWNGKNKRD